MIYKRLRENWQSALAVTMINIPLSLSLSVASGLTPLQGLLTGIWGMSIAALFASSNFNIFGPAGALTAVILGFAMKYGAIYVPLLALVTGVISLIVYKLKIVKYITLIPSATLHGFILGVGLTIISTQLNGAFGLVDLPKHEVLFFNLLETINHLGWIDRDTFLVFVFSLLLLIVMKKLTPRLPGVVVVSLLGMLVGYLVSVSILPFSITTLADKFPDLSFHFYDPALYTFSWVQGINLSVLRGILLTGVVVAIIAILETIVSAKVAQSMTKERFNKNKEVLGLGLSNIVTGLIGGVPSTAVLVRTALNVKSGATHRTSAFLTGVFSLLICMLLFNNVFVYLPMPVISAILINIALAMINIRHYASLWNVDKTSVILIFFVGIVTFVEDPTMGLVVGIGLALIIYLKRIIKGNAYVTVFRDKKFFDKELLVNYCYHQDEKDIVAVKMFGELNYLNIDSFTDQFLSINKPRTVIVSFSQTSNIDLDGLETLQEMVEHFTHYGIDLYFTGLKSEISSLLNTLPVYQEMVKNKKIADSTSDVLHQML